MPYLRFKANAAKGITAAIGAIMVASLLRKKPFNCTFKKLTLILLFCCTAFVQTSFAQNNLKEHYLNDVILFKNGGLLYGKILSIVDGVIKFEMLTEKVVNIKMKQVKKIMQFDSEATTQLKMYLKKPYQFKEQGIYNVTYFNLPQGFNQWDSGLGVHHITEKQFNR